MSFAIWLAALLRRFHGGQTPGEYYKPPPVYHSLGARGPRRDADGNPIPDDNPYNRAQIWYGDGKPEINPLTGKRSWMSRSR